MIGDLKEVEDFKGNLNYEQLIARAIDRCLYFRSTDPFGAYYRSVCALKLSLVDMPGKNLRSEIEKFLLEKGYEDILSRVTNSQNLKDFDVIFEEITRILSKHHMLFRSQIIETNV